MSGDLGSRTATALRQFDSNMNAIFDRTAFYDGDLYSTKGSSPALSSAQGCFKWSLLFANTLFLIFGVVLMSVGAYALNNPVGALSGQTLPQGLIAMGVFIMFVSLLGGISAWVESRNLLFIYFFFLLLFTIILFCVGIAVYVKRNDSATYINEGWTAANTDLRRSLQSAFSCCGLLTWNDSQAVLPCPGYSFSSSGAIIATPPPSFMVGCSAALQSSFNSSFTTAGGCAIAFAVIMILGMAFVLYLINGIKKKRLEQDLQTLRQSNDVDPNQIEVGVGGATTTGEVVETEDPYMN